MTGIVGNHGEFLAERHPIAVTTGNSLTVYATLRNLEHYCESFGIDLADEEIAVVGIPGSIATAVAALLAPRCRGLVLGARRTSTRATHLAERLGARLEVDLPTALAEASIVVTATSSGDCIDPGWLRPGCLVLDVGVPSDVRRAEPARDDVLILSAGYARVPASMPRDSFFLRFYHGIVPSCLGETMVLALENRADSFSIGRELSLDRVREIGRLAEAHGFVFSEALACGQSLTPEARSQYLKVLSRTRTSRSRPSRRYDEQALSERPADEAINLADLAGHAAERYARHINPVLIGVGGPSGLTRTFVRGEGAELFDESGRAYLDFVAGFGSLNLGHNHPEVAAAVASALRQQAPGFSPASVNPLAAALAEQLVAITPRGLEMVFFTNSGAESVEAALKLARAATGRSGLLSCLGSFHGKTFGALSVTGNRTYQGPFAPLVPDCQAIPYGDAKALELALATRRHAAFVVEPIQGEGGMITPPPGYLAEAHRLCRQAGTLFIADEVQTGLGRTGPLFAVERDGIEPDILALAKSLGGGLMPLGAMIARRDVWMKAYGSYQTFALHSSTFSGGSLACAAGLATLRVLRESPVLVDAARRGTQLRQGLEAIARSCPIIREVRGRGPDARPGIPRAIPDAAHQLQGIRLVGGELVAGARSRGSPPHDPGAVRAIEPAPRARDLYPGRPLEPPGAPGPASPDRERGPGGSIPRGAPGDLRRVGPDRRHRRSDPEQVGRRDGAEVNPSPLLAIRHSFEQGDQTMPASDEIDAKVTRVLVQALGVEEEDVKPSATLQGDLGAESIDFLDIVFRLEREFMIRIDRNELFPEPFLMKDSAFFGDGRLTDDGLAALRAQMPFADWKELERDRQIDRVDDLFTVDLVTSYVRWKVGGTGTAATDAGAPSPRLSRENSRPSAISTGSPAAQARARSAGVA